MLALAMLAGMAAAGLAYFGLAAGQTQGAIGSAGERPVAVVVAARDLPARRLLAAATLRVRRLPASDVPAGSVAAPEELAGQVTTCAIGAGQPVTRGMVTARSASPGLAGSVGPARRAVSVALDPDSGAAGFLEPGDHVDVLATFEAAGGQGAVTRTILQDARLLALGGRTDGDEKPATSATLEVTPRAAQVLALAAARGKVQLALRGLDDAAQPPVPALDSAEETGQMAPPEPVGAWHAKPAQPPAKPAQPPAKPAKPAARPRPAAAPAAPKAAATAALPRITVIRGSETTTVTVGE